MQCFGGCFAADKDLSKGAGTAADSSWASKTGSKNGAGAGASPSFATADGSMPDADVAGRVTLKAKLRLLSNSKSGKQQDTADGVTYTSTNESSAADRERLRQEYLMNHGRHILGISTLQQEQLRHFVVPGIGYMAYALMANGLETFMDVKTPVCLSDPVCDKKHFRTMAAAFIKEHPKAMFVQVSYDFAAILQEFDFTCNSMGGETRLDIATYNFTGYARRGLRSAIASAVKDGIKVEEVMNPAPDTFGSAASKGAGAAATAALGTDWVKLADELKNIDAKWAASKNGRANDVWFINRPPVFAPEAGVRKFIARNAAGELQGFIFFDGVFEDGQLTGYYANITRLLPDAHPGTLNLIMKEFIERVRAEAQLSAPAKKLSMRKSQRKKLEAAAAAAAAGADGAADATPASAADQQQQEEAAAAPAGPKFLSLGLSPFYQMNNSLFKHCKMTHLLLLLCYEDGAGFYPFKTLAAAKAKYGAGLHNFKYEDPNVEYRNAFLCHNRKGLNASFWCMFDLAKLYGFWTDPADCFGRYFSYKGKQGAGLVAKGLKKATTLDTYKPKKSKKSKSFSGSSSKSSNSSVTAKDSDVLRSASAPAAVSGGGKGKAAAAAPKQGKKGQKAAAAAAAGAAGAGAVAAAAGASTGSPLTQNSRAQSEASLIATASNPPGAMSSTEASGSDRSSDASSYVSAVPSHTSDDNNTRISSSDSDN